MWYDSTYILVLIGLFVSMLAQFGVNRAYEKWNSVPTRTGMRGVDMARRILDENGAAHVAIECIPGRLTDHYDPQNNVLRLSDAVYHSDSVAALGVAAHEAGHAIQDAEDYAPLRIRSNLVPIANIGSQAAIPLFLLGSFLSFPQLMQIGIACFAAAVLFYLVTLPVEFNASGRAVRLLESGIMPEDETRGVRAVLRAAAMTYVASALQAMLQLLRLILLSSNRRRRR